MLRPAIRRLCQGRTVSEPVVGAVVQNAYGADGFPQSPVTRAAAVHVRFVEPLTAACYEQSMEEQDWQRALIELNTEEAEIDEAVRHSHDEIRRSYPRQVQSGL
jgi:hypothetical protein